MAIVVVDRDVAAQHHDHVEHCGDGQRDVCCQVDHNLSVMWFVGAKVMLFANFSAAGPGKLFFSGGAHGHPSILYIMCDGSCRLLEGGGRPCGPSPIAVVRALEKREIGVKIGLISIKSC